MFHKLFPNLSTTTSIVASIILLAIGCGIYIYNMQMFRVIFKFERLSGSSGLYEKTIGQISNINIRMFQANSNKYLKQYYALSMNYAFVCDGKKYIGEKEFTQTYDMIDNAIKKCKELYPNQIIHLIIKPDLARKNPPDFDEYKTYLRFMKYDYKPTQSLTPIDIYYNKTRPKENCLVLETRLPDILQLIFWVIFVTFVGSAIFAYFIQIDVFWRKLLIVATVLLTAIIPGYFIKPSFKSNQFPDKKEDIILFDIVVDQNSSEKYLKEQIYQQKIKFQNELIKNN